MERQSWQSHHHQLLEHTNATWCPSLGLYYVHLIGSGYVLILLFVAENVTLTLIRDHRAPNQDKAQRNLDTVQYGVYGKQSRSLRQPVCKRGKSAHSPY